MDWLAAISILLAVVGVGFGIHGYFSNRTIARSLIREKALIADKIRDLRSEWLHKKNMILNEAKKRPKENVNAYMWQLRIEEVESKIEILDRFVERLDSAK